MAVIHLPHLSLRAMRVQISVCEDVLKHESLIQMQSIICGIKTSALLVSPFGYISFVLEILKIMNLCELLEM